MNKNADQLVAFVRMLPAPAAEEPTAGEATE